VIAKSDTKVKPQRVTTSKRAEQGDGKGSSLRAREELFGRGEGETIGEVGH